MVKIETFKQEPIEPYAIVECIEPVDDYDGNVKMEAENSFDEDTFNDDELIPETLLEVKQSESIVFKEVPKRRKPSLPYMKRVNGKHCCDQCDYKISKFVLKVKKVCKISFLWFLLQARRIDTSQMEET